MKDCSESIYRTGRPRQVDAAGAIAFCLERLFADGAHRAGEEVVQRLTFEELIGALLLAEDELGRVLRIAVSDDSEAAFRAHAKVVDKGPRP